MFSKIYSLRIRKIISTHEHGEWYGKYFNLIQIKPYHVNSSQSHHNSQIKSYHHASNRIKALKYAIVSSYIVLEAKNFSTQEAKHHNYKYT